MAKFKQYLLVFLGFLTQLYCLSTHQKKECDQLLCAPIVSKCLITESCNCKLSECHCCKDCHLCLGRLFDDCCGCLDICEKAKPKVPMKSQIGDFVGVPELFQSVIEDTLHYDWTVMEMPPHKNPDLDIPNSIDQDDLMNSIPNSSNLNCTLIYLTTCMGIGKCSSFCESIGAKSYRWFNEGCCECIGSNCNSYGLNENHCAACAEGGKAFTDDYNDNNIIDKIFNYISGDKNNNLVNDSKPENVQKNDNNQEKKDDNKNMDNYNDLYWDYNDDDDDIDYN